MQIVKLRLGKIERSLFEKAMNKTSTIAEKIEVFKLVEGSDLENEAIVKITAHLTGNDCIDGILSDLELILKN